MRDMMPEIGSFVALGDSFTEGLGDPYADGTGYQGLGYSAWSWRGWADRFAERLAAGQPGRLRYANLAVRGKMVGEVAAEQVPLAVAMAARCAVGAGVRRALVQPAAARRVLWRRHPAQAAGDAAAVRPGCWRCRGCEGYLITHRGSPQRIGTG
jgi:hypothetical protein